MRTCAEARLFLSRSRSFGPSSQTSDAECFRSKAKLFLASAASDASDRDAAAVHDWFLPVSDWLGGVAGRNQDAGHATSSGYPAQPGGIQGRSQFFPDDNRCTADVDTRVDCRLLAADDTGKAETIFGSKDNGASCSNRLLSRLRMNLRGKDKPAKQSTQFRNCCRVLYRVLDNGGSLWTFPQWRCGSDLDRRKWLRFSPASTQSAADWAGIRRPPMVGVVRGVVAFVFLLFVKLPISIEVITGAQRA